jgi:hypothetical protein
MLTYVSCRLSDTYLNDLLLKYCEAALADRKGDVSQLRTNVLEPWRAQSACIAQS